MPNLDVVGAVTVYDHHRQGNIISTFILILSTTRVEVVVVKGKSQQAQKLGDLLISREGVRHGRLVLR